MKCANCGAHESDEPVAGCSEMEISEISRSRKEGYDEGLEAGREDKVAFYERQIIDLKHHVQSLEERIRLAFGK